MKNTIKYSSLFMGVWLYFFYFFEQLNAILTSYSTIDIVIMGSMAVYAIIFLTYFFLLQARKLSQQLINKSEHVIILLNLLLAGGVFAYYMSNPWLWQEAESLNLILLEVWKFAAMLGAALVAGVLHFILKVRFDLDNRQYWNTYHTFDGIFFLLVTITAFGLSSATSRMIPYTDRNYFEFLRMTIVLIIMGLSYHHGRVFQSQRQLFYTTIIGYFCAALSEGIEFLFVMGPLLRQQFEAMNFSTTRVTLINVFIIINLIVLSGWLLWVYRQETNVQKSISK